MIKKTRQNTAYIEKADSTDMEILELHQPPCSDSDECCKTETRTSTEEIPEKVELEMLDPDNRIQSSHQAKGTIFEGRCSNKWSIPWIVLMNTAVQITFFACSNEELYKFCMFSPYKKIELWRFLSYMLLHSDLVHLSLNVLLMALSAYPLEIEQDSFKVLVIYLTGGLSGALGTSIFEPKLSLVGCSAGVYSLLISHIPHLLLNYSIRFKYFRIVAIILLTSADGVFLVLHMFQHKSKRAPISFAAHLSGGFNGLILGFAIFQEQRRNQFRSYKRISLIFYVTSLCALFYLTFECGKNKMEKNCFTFYRE